MAFSVLSLNVQGLNKTIKGRQWLHQQKSQNLISWEAEWGGKIIGGHGTNHSQGVMILLKSNLM